MKDICHTKEEHIFKFLVNLVLQQTDLLFQVFASLDLNAFLISLTDHHSPNSAFHLTLCFKAVWLPFLVCNTHFFPCNLSLPALLMVQTLISGRFSSASSACAPFPAVSQHIFAHLSSLCSIAPGFCCYTGAPSCPVPRFPFLPHPHQKRSLASFLCLAMSPSSPGWIIPGGSSFFWNCFCLFPFRYFPISLCRPLIPHRFSSQVFLL